MFVSNETDSFNSWHFERNTDGDDCCCLADVNEQAGYIFRTRASNEPARRDNILDVNVICPEYRFASALEHVRTSNSPRPNAAYMWIFSTTTPRRLSSTRNSKESKRNCDEDQITRNTARLRFYKWLIATALNFES